jgi:hypothetical protein
MTEQAIGMGTKMMTLITRLVLTERAATMTILTTTSAAGGRTGASGRLLARISAVVLVRIRSHSLQSARYTAGGETLAHQCSSNLWLNRGATLFRRTVMRFLLGFAVGFGLGLLIAPASGAETRDNIAHRMRDLAEIPRQKAEAAAEAAKKRAGELGSRVGREAAEAAVDAVEKDVLGKDQPA